MDLIADGLRSLLSGVRWFEEEENWMVGVFL